MLPRGDHKPIESALRRPPQGPVHLVPFIPAGFGGYQATSAAVLGVAEAGASVIELGVPFSDPVADGPVIQAAYDDALKRGTTVPGVLELVGELRARVRVPMLAMVSYSIVFRAGVEAFCGRARSAGLDGLLCPDLPPPEGEDFCRIARASGLEPVLLVAPTTPPARRDVIGELAGGFVYYLSVAGTTGERSELPPELADGVADMRGRTALPVCVGFGIGRGAQVRGLKGVADGAIVGSAYVKRMNRCLAEGADGMADGCAELTRELLSAA
jgi:tryptophan synthase alpha chain